MILITTMAEVGIVSGSCFHLFIVGLELGFSSELGFDAATTYNTAIPAAFRE